MIELVAQGDIDYDCTYNYNVLIKNICTVSQFVTNVTKRDDSNHGMISVIDNESNAVLCRFYYKDNQMKYDTKSEQNWKDISRSIVLGAIANGGYGSMAYDIYINL